MTEHALTLTRRYDGYFVASFDDVPEAIAYGRDSQEAIEEATKALAKAETGATISLPETPADHDSARSFLVQSASD